MLQLCLEFYFLQTDTAWEEHVHELAIGGSWKKTVRGRDESSCTRMWWRSWLAPWYTAAPPAHMPLLSLHIHLLNNRGWVPGGKRAHHNSASPAGVTIHSVLSTNCGFLHWCWRIHGKTLAASIRGKGHILAPCHQNQLKKKHRACNHERGTQVLQGMCGPKTYVHAVLQPSWEATGLETVITKPSKTRSSCLTIIPAQEHQASLISIKDHLRYTGVQSHAVCNWEKSMQKCSLGPPWTGDGLSKEVFTFKHEGRTIETCWSRLEKPQQDGISLALKDKD